MGAITSVCIPERSSSPSQTGGSEGRLSRKILADVFAPCSTMDEWIAIRRVSKGFKRFVDSQVAVDLVIEWQMKKDSIGIEPENMTFGIYADLSIGGNHVLERYDEIDKLIWLWPTVLIRSISVHCFYLTNHATNGDFRMHHYLLQELANFLELVSSKSLKNLKKLEFATQDSFSSFFVCPDYTIPQFKRILARLPSNMDSIEFQTFPNNDGLIGHLLGLKPKSLLILGNDELLEDSLDLMKHNYDTTLYMYLTSIEDHEGLLESYDNLCEIWRTSMKKHSNAIHVQFTETNRVTEFLENKVKASEERRCVHFPTAIFKLDYKITKRYGTHTEAGLSLTVEERSERKTSLRKIKKETKDLYLLPRKFSLMDGISLNDLPDYESCVRADSPPYSPSCDTYPHEGFQMEDVDLEAKCLDRFMEFDDYERLILNAIQAV